MPIIITVNQTPDHVEYYHQVNITTVVLNITDLTSVQLFYRVNFEDWYTQEMTNLTADTFCGVIPRQSWNSQVDYYVNATDELGQSTIDDNHTSYYRYVVVDTIPPEIHISQPRNGELFQGLVTFDVDFSDAGSGIARHLDYINENLVGNGTADSYVSVTDLPNGEYEFTLHVFDHAGNQAEAHVVFRVEKPFAIPVIFYSLGALGAIIVICIIVGAWLYQKEN